MALAGAPLLFSLLLAQTPASERRAVASITPEDIRHRIAVLAADSMRGRDTPSPELEQAARWVASEFRRFGLAPGAGADSYLQRYPIVRRQLDASGCTVHVERRGAAPMTLEGVDAVRVLRLGPPLPSGDVSGPVVLLAGVTGDLPRGLSVRGAWVAELASMRQGMLRANLTAAQQALEAGAIGVLLISDASDAEWTEAASDTPAVEIVAGEPPARSAPAIAELRDRTAAALFAIDLEPLRAMHVDHVRRLDGVVLTLHVRQRVLSRASAPNVIGILEGSDSVLRREYIFFTAHLDHLGVASATNESCHARGADSICNGADDDASGVAAVLTNAAAFAQLTPRPRRSLVFMTVTGEEKGLWGSAYFTAHPTVPLTSVVADLNTDMIGRNWRDTVAAIGRDQSDLGATLDRVAAAHPELDMTPVGDLWPAESFYTRSDHYNFARHGVPILFFFSGTHPDYHEVSDEVSKIDAEKESRIVKLVFYLGLEIANATARPRWDPASYERVVDDTN